MSADVTSGGPRAPGPGPAGGGRRARDVAPEEGVYVISIAAELAGMHPQTLRTYERRGLIDPVRSAGNTRRYSQRDVERLRLIQRLTQRDGLNLAGVQRVLELREELAAARARIGELEQRVETLVERLREDVEAAHRSHRHELVPMPKGELVLYAPSGRRPTAWR